MRALLTTQPLSSPLQLSDSSSRKLDGRSEKRSATYTKPVTNSLTDRNTRCIKTALFRNTSTPLDEQDDAGLAQLRQREQNATRCRLGGSHCG